MVLSRIFDVFIGRVRILVPRNQAAFPTCQVILVENQTFASGALFRSQIVRLSRAILQLPY